MSQAATPEFSRLVSLRQITGKPVFLEADESECAALARRFAITEVCSLTAEISLDRNGDRVAAQGRLEADIVQPCAVSGEDFPVHIEEDIALRFVPEGSIDPALQEGEEIEIELVPSAADPEKTAELSLS